MKTLEIILRLVDKLLAAISFRKAQNARDDLAKNPANWFSEHFGSVQSDKRQADKTTSASDTTN